MTDAMLLLMYERWSEQFYAASFMDPSEHTVQQFRKWLAIYEELGPSEDYEHAMLAEYRRQGQAL